MIKLIRTQADAMTQELIERSRKRLEFADVAVVITTLALILSLVVAFTTVSIGIARADTLVPFGGGDNGRIALAMMFGVLIAGTAGLTAALVRNDCSSRRRD